MSAQSEFEDATRPKFDVFLAYNSSDEDAVRRVNLVSEALARHGKVGWLARRDAIVGTASTRAMAEGIAASACTALFHGKLGLGPWQRGFEANLAIERSIKQPDYRTFVVLLPGSDGDPALPAELRVTTVLDLRKDFTGEGLSSEGDEKVLAAVMGISVREMSKLREREAKSTRPSQGGRYRALLVGVSRYDDPDLLKLGGPQNDIVQLARTLDQAAMSAGRKWQVTKCPDPDYTTFRKALWSFFGDETAKDDTVLFYYSGHGVVKGDSYLCATDTVLKQPAFSSISATQVAEVIKACEASAKVVILDCCHAAPIPQDRNPYLALGTDAAVVAASRGPAGDAKVLSEPSPFTKKLVGALGDPRAYGDKGLTVGSLVAALEQAGEKPWTEAAHPEIMLVRWPPRREPERMAPSPGISVIVSADGVQKDRLAVVRQLAATLDGLLAVAREESRIPTSVVNQAIWVLGQELRNMVPDEVRPKLRINGDPHVIGPSTVNLEFADETSRAQLADLPWEYLSMCRMGVDDPEADDVMRDPSFVIERIITASGTKQPTQSTIQHVAIFSSLTPIEPSAKLHVLTQTTADALKDSRTSVELVPPATWQIFSSHPDAADAVILHLPISLIGRSVSASFMPTSGSQSKVVHMDSLCDQLKERRSLTWLFIEAIADDPRVQPALAVRRLAGHLAMKLERPVVAACHTCAYATCLAENADLFESGTAKPFLAQLLVELHRGSTLDRASHDARQRVLSNLAISEPAIVGIPTVIRPVQRQEPAASQRPVARPAA